MQTLSTWVRQNEKFKLSAEDEINKSSKIMQTLSRRMRQMKSRDHLKRMKSIITETECRHWAEEWDKWKVETGWRGWSQLLMKQNADIEQKNETNEKKRQAEENEINNSWKKMRILNRWKRQMKNLNRLKRMKSIIVKRECGYWTDERDKWRDQTLWRGINQ